MRILAIVSVVLFFLGSSSRVDSSPLTLGPHLDWRTECGLKSNHSLDGESIIVRLYDKAHSLLALEYFPAVRNALPDQLLYTMLSGIEEPARVSCVTTKGESADTMVRVCDNNSWPSVDQGLIITAREIVVGNGWVMLLADDNYIGFISGVPTHTTADVIGARLDADESLWQLVLPAQQTSAYYFTFSPSSEHKILLGTRDPANLGASAFLFPTSQLCIGVTKRFAPTFSAAPPTENMAWDWSTHC